MTTNAQKLREMFERFWSYLTGSTDFIQLGLHPFAVVLGDPMPVLGDGSIPADALPAFFVERMSPAPSRAESDNYASQRVRSFTVECAAVYPSIVPHQAQAGFDAMSAVMTMEDILGSYAARNGGIAGSPQVDDFEFVPGEVEAVPSVNNQQVVMYWVGRFSVRLDKLIQYAR